MREIGRVINGLGIPESTRWHDGRVWLCNWGAGENLAVSTGGESEVTAHLAPQTLPFSVDWLPDGRLLAVDGPRRLLLRLEPDRALAPVAELNSLGDGAANELVVDRAGNAFVNGGAGSVVRVTPDGSVRKVAEGLAIGLLVYNAAYSYIGPYLEQTVADKLRVLDVNCRGPLVLTFYRGVWCPYCNMELQALEAAKPEFDRYGASLVAISPQTAPNSRKSVRQNKLSFPILSDAKGKVGAAFGLRFDLPDYLVELYKQLKNDLPTFNDDPSWTLPMPARYVIGQDGVILYSEVNPDYTRRPEPEDMIPVLQRAAAVKV